jgi:integrase
MPELTNAALKGLIKKPGRHGDGGGLYFRVVDPTKAYWAYRYRADGRTREMSLGPYPELGLAEARMKHAQMRARVIADKDPLSEKRAERQAREGARSIPTFGEAADGHLRAHQDSRKNDRHRRQWFVALTRYCAPIRALPVNEVGTKEVLQVLKPVWTRAPEIASRLRGRIETVLDSARALGHIDADRANPARWRGHLDHLLPNPNKIGERGHHAAMPYRDVPAFVAKLRSSSGSAAKALVLAILCASRSSEVFGMTWDEVDLDAKLWVAPGERMKMGVEHHVPLSDAAFDLLRGQLAARRPKQAHVFPGARPQKPLSNMALAMTMRRLGAGQYTVHGFRSSFRDWAADRGVEFDVAEQCLAHAVGSSVTRAYLRTTMIERRRKVMADWATFLAGESEQATVVSFGDKRLKRGGVRETAAGA